MLCSKCRKETPDGSTFCCCCGTRLERAARTGKHRGNGQGSVYKMPSGTWAAEVTLGWYMQDGVLRRKRSRKYGFRTKKEAINYLSSMYEQHQKRSRVTVSELYQLFEDASDKLS